MSECVCACVFRSMCPILLRLNVSHCLLKVWYTKPNRQIYRERERERGCVSLGVCLFDLYPLHLNPFHPGHVLGP